MIDDDNDSDDEEALDAHPRDHNAFPRCS